MHLTDFCFRQKFLKFLCHLFYTVTNFRTKHSDRWNIQNQLGLPLSKSQTVYHNGGVFLTMLFNPYQAACIQFVNKRFSKLCKIVKMRNF